MLCGLLIGKYGAFVNQIKSKTGASLLIKDHNKRFKLCAIEGDFVLSSLAGTAQE